MLFIFVWSKEDAGQKHRDTFFAVPPTRLPSQELAPGDVAFGGGPSASRWAPSKAQLSYDWAEITSAYK